MTQYEVPPRLRYRASDGGDFDFEFDLRPGGGWRIYVLSRLDYRGRSTTSVAAHFYTDRRGAYICWDSRIDSFRDAQQVAAAWAEATLHYIQTGDFTVPPHAPPIGYYHPRAARAPVPEPGRRPPRWWERIGRHSS